MPSTPSIPSEADIIFNRASVALAKSQRLIASWLPPPTASELVNAKSQEEREQEEQEMFTPVPELLGLGATIPHEGEAKQQKQDTEEKLRRHLLGKDYAKQRAKHVKAGSRIGSGTSHLGSESEPRATKPKAEVDSDVEEGRSSLGKSKRPNMKHSRQDIDDIDGTPAMSIPPKRSNNYLDEVLAEKAFKRSKKLKRRSNPPAGDRE